MAKAEQELKELALIPRRMLPVSIGVLPPRPVWQEQIAAFVEKANFVFPKIACTSREDFEALKGLSTEGVRFEHAIEASYVEILRAFDDAKQPVLDQRKEDIAKVRPLIDSWDNTAKVWLNAEQKKAQEKLDKERQEEFERRQAKAKREAEEAEAKRLQELELAKEWGDEETAKTIEDAGPVVPDAVEMPRAAKAETGLTYRKGSKTKQKYVFEIDDPDKVNPAYKMPDPKLIKAKTANYFALLDNPTKEQIKVLEDEIGGGHIVLE